MYERDISRRDPGCVVFLLDRSDSMKSTWVNSQETLAQGAARVLNEILLELLFTSQGEPGKARHYFDIGIFGYGLRPVAGGEGVEVRRDGVGVAITAEVWTVVFGGDPEDVHLFHCRRLLRLPAVRDCRFGHRRSLSG